MSKLSEKGFYQHHGFRMYTVDLYFWTTLLVFKMVDFSKEIVMIEKTDDFDHSRTIINTP